MGLWEYIKRSLNLGTDDMTMVHEVPMDSFRATDTSHTMRSGKYWPFKKMFMSADGRVPPGFVLEPNGKIINPGIYDATMGDAIRVMPMYGLSTSDTHGAVLLNATYGIPENTIGSALRTYNTQPDEWKWGSVQITGATDTELVATVAGKKIQIVITSISVVQGTTNDASLPVVCTLQDSDNVQLTGAAVFRVSSFYKTQIGASCTVLTFPWMGAVAYSATANRAIEMDVSMTGLGAADYVQVTYAWREFA